VKSIEALPAELIAGHLIVRLGEARLLLDTGSPVSITSGRAIVIGGHPVQSEAVHPGASIADLRQLTGVVIDALIGMDVLSRFDIAFKLRRAIVKLREPGLPGSKGRSMPIEIVDSIPIVSLSIDGRTRRLFFDTGAPVSYLIDASLADRPSVGRVPDFYPGFGPFETDQYEIPVDLANQTRGLRFGRLPEALESGVRALGVDGILGTEILMLANVTLSVTSREVQIRWH